MNPYDLYALETALRIKEKKGGHIKVISMGPPQAKAVIKEAYSMGADEGTLVSDRKFAGADVLATSYTLSQGVKNVEILILFFVENKLQMEIQHRLDLKWLNI